MTNVIRDIYYTLGNKYHKEFTQSKLNLENSYKRWEKLTIANYTPWEIKEKEMREFDRRIKNFHYPRELGFYILAYLLTNLFTCMID